MLDILLWVAAVLLMVLLLLAVWRFLTLRHQGTSALVRSLPNPSTRGWRHGVIKYGGHSFFFFKLRSVSPQADLELDRSELVFRETRQLSVGEAGFMDSQFVVCVLESASKTYEVAMHLRGAMALRAWVESAPDKRQERVDVHRLRRKFDNK